MIVSSWKQESEFSFCPHGYRPGVHNEWYTVSQRWAISTYQGWARAILWGAQHQPSPTFSYFKSCDFIGDLFLVEKNVSASVLPCSVLLDGAPRRKSQFSMFTWCSQGTNIPPAAFTTKRSEIKRVIWFTTSSQVQHVPRLSLWNRL